VPGYPPGVSLWLLGVGDAASAGLTRLDLTCYSAPMSEMIEVTHDEFFDFIGPRDIVPRAERGFTSWETRNRLEVGRTLPGYMGGGQKRYFVRPAFRGS
jgi:hypothetical protein